MNTKIVAALLLLLVFSGGVAFAQCSTPRDFDEWINCRVEQIASARINQRGNTQQTESPAVSSNSTSLVDQSSAPDLVGLALNRKKSAVVGLNPCNALHKGVRGIRQKLR